MQQGSWKRPRTNTEENKATENKKNNRTLKIILWGYFRPLIPHLCWLYKSHSKKWFKMKRCVQLEIPTACGHWLNFAENSRLLQLAKMERPTNAEQLSGLQIPQPRVPFLLPHCIMKDKPRYPLIACSSTQLSQRVLCGSWSWSIIEDMNYRQWCELH